MISYEGSKWYVKVWRQRWYLYAIFLYIKNLIDIELWIDSILNINSDDVYKKTTHNWIDIKKHVELTKMYKFSTKRRKNYD